MSIKVNERTPGANNANTIVFGDNMGNRMDFQYFSTNIRLRCGVKCTSLTRNEPTYADAEPKGMKKVNWDSSYGAPTIKATVTESMATGKLSLFTRQGGAIESDITELFIRAAAGGDYEVFANKSPFPKTNCTTCKGLSALTCTNCNGKGRFKHVGSWAVRWDNCTTCKGYGVLMCSNCEQDMLKREYKEDGYRFRDFLLDQGTLSKNMEGWQLENANFSNFDLSSVNLKNANLRNANLEGANLANALFNGANLTGASLKKSTLDMTILSGAQLADANFEQASLIDAEIKNADLTGANFKNSLVGDVKVDGSNLTRADFTGSKIMPDKWEGSKDDGEWIEFGGFMDDEHTIKTDTIGWPI